MEWVLKLNRMDIKLMQIKNNTKNLPKTENRYCSPADWESMNTKLQQLRRTTAEALFRAARCQHGE